MIVSSDLFIWFTSNIIEQDAYWPCENYWKTLSGNIANSFALKKGEALLVLQEHKTYAWK